MFHLINDEKFNDLMKKKKLNRQALSLMIDRNHIVEELSQAEKSSNGFVVRA